ncbi:MAG: bifunctional oligoribonuclease/PAP phosphatase NrnA [Clostridia bacterium]|nr:bifunctional oligoribonuclease/PAP phosphatase NrnA [Clostridia bacterium]
MEKKIKEIIEKAKSVVVLCHFNSDCDALGSAYAVTELLKNLGKKAVCCLEEEPERRLRFLGEDYVVYSGKAEYECDLCIAVDCGSIDRLGSRAEIFRSAKVTINIDHHKTNTYFADVNYVAGDLSATAELLAVIFSECGYDITDRIAMLLYAGIMSDSGCFKYPSATPDTLRVVACLMEYDFDHAEVARLLFDSQPMELVKFKGHIMNNVQSIDGGRISLIETDSRMLKKYGVSESDAGDLINIPRQIEGVEIAIEVKERSGCVRLSLRSNGKAEVDRIAGKFGGGGHLRAAGATMTGMTPEEAREAVLEAAREELKRIDK